MTSHKMQELIDEHKEDMNENLYLELCNKLMKLNKQEEKEKEKEKQKLFVFKITYLQPYIKNTTYNEFEIDMKRKQLYIPLTKKEYKEIKDRLDDLGHFTAHIIYDKMDENVKINWSYTNTKFNKDFYEDRIENECNEFCDDDDCKCGLVINSTHFTVKVWREIVKIEKVKLS